MDSSNEDVIETGNNFQEFYSKLQKIQKGETFPSIEAVMKTKGIKHVLDIEWGLAKRNGNYHIIFGGAKEINWKDLLDVGILPLGHSHPLKNRTLPNPIALAALMNHKSKSVEVAQSRMLIFPSSSDLLICERASREFNVHEHTVFTPYHYDAASQMVVNPGPTKPGNLCFVLKQFGEVAPKPSTDVKKVSTDVKRKTCTVDAVVDGKVLFTKKAWTASSIGSQASFILLDFDQ